MTSPRDIQAALDRAVELKGDECLPWPYGHDKDGYGKLRRGSYSRVSQIVLDLTGQPRPSPDSHALHSCDNPGCVNPGHLRWGTHQENMNDRNSRGRHRRVNRGSKHGNAKLTEDVVRDLRTRYRAGGVSYRTLADEVGLSTMTVYFAVTGRGWGHVNV